MQLACEEVTKQYGSVLALDRLSLDIDSGEFVVLLGPSGCGKTTTLRLIAGLEEVSSGRILIDGRCVNRVPPRDRDVAMVFQNYALYPHMTIEENIGYPLRIRRLRRAEIQSRVGAVAQMLGIGPLLKRRPREVSGGERQRVALARALVRQPRVCLMDEPLSNLDAQLRFQMRGELKRLQYELGTTTLYVTHDQAEAMTLAHRVAVLRNGRLQQFDSPLEVYQHPANTFVASFIGSPSMNMIDGRVDLAARCFVKENLVIPLDPSILGQLEGHEHVTLGFRPEHVKIGLTAGGLEARVFVTEPMGSETFVFAKLGQQTVVARVPSGVSLGIDSIANITLDPTSLLFFDADSGNRLA